MTVDEILKLGAMGFTKEDIEKMDAPQQEPEKDPEPEQAAPEPEKKEEPAKAEPAKAEPEQDILKFIAGEFEKLNKSIQLANINGSNIDKPNAKTAEDVLAELLAPPKKGGK